jgi:hypothetical protein
MPRTAQYLLHDRVVRLRPVDALLEGLEIDDVADEEKLVRGVAAQEIDEPVGLARAHAEVNV